MNEDEYVEKKRKVDLAKTVIDKAIQLLLEKNGGSDCRETSEAAAENKWNVKPKKKALKNSMRMLRETYFEPKQNQMWRVFYLMYKRSFLGKPFIPSGLSKEIDENFKSISSCARRFLIPTGLPPQYLTKEEIKAFEESAVDLPADEFFPFKGAMKQMYAEKIAPYQWLSEELRCLGAAKRVDERFGFDGGRRALFGNPQQQWTDAVKLRNGILNDLYNIVMHCCDEKGQFKPEYLPKEDDDSDSDDDSEDEEEEEEEEEEKEKKDEKEEEKKSEAEEVLGDIVANMEENAKEQEAKDEEKRISSGKYTKCTFCGKTAVWEGCCTICQMIPASELTKDWTPEMMSTWQKLRAMDEE